MVRHVQPSAGPVELVRLDCPRTGDTVQISYGADLDGYISFGYADAGTFEVDMDRAFVIQSLWHIAIRLAEGTQPGLWSTADLPIEVARLACPRSRNTVQISYGADGTQSFAAIGFADEDTVEFTPHEARTAMDHFVKAMEAATAQARPAPASSKPR